MDPLTPRLPSSSSPAVEYISTFADLSWECAVAVCEQLHIKCPRLHQYGGYRSKYKPWYQTWLQAVLTLKSPMRLELVICRSSLEPFTTNSSGYNSQEISYASSDSSGNDSPRLRATPSGNRRNYSSRRPPQRGTSSGSSSGSAVSHVMRPASRPCPGQKSRGLAMRRSHPLATHWESTSQEDLHSLLGKQGLSLLSRNRSRSAHDLHYGGLNSHCYLEQSVPQRAAIDPASLRSSSSSHVTMFLPPARDRPPSRAPGQLVVDRARQWCDIENEWRHSESNLLEKQVYQPPKQCQHPPKQKPERKTHKQKLLIEPIVNGRNKRFPSDIENERDQRQTKNLVKSEPKQHQCLSTTEAKQHQCLSTSEAKQHQHPPTSEARQHQYPSTPGTNQHQYTVPLAPPLPTVVSSPSAFGDNGEDHAATSDEKDKGVQETEVSCAPPPPSLSLSTLVPGCRRGGISEGGLQQKRSPVEKSAGDADVNRHEQLMAEFRNAHRRMFGDCENDMNNSPGGSPENLPSRTADKQDRRRRTELLRQNGGVHESHAEVLLPGEGCRTPAASSFLGEQGTGSRLNTPASLSKQETGKMLYTGPIAWKDKSRSTCRKNIDMNDVERMTVSDHQSTKETVVNGSASPITPPNAGDCRKKSNKPCKKVCVKVDPYMIINPAFNAGNHTPSRETPSSFSSNHAHGVGSHSMEPFALESSTSFEAPKPPNTYFDNPKKTSACCSQTELESYRVNPYKQEELDKQQLKLGNNDPQPQISIID